MTREFKHYELKSTVRPAHSPLLSTTAVVVKADGARGYCYISFSGKLIEAVGKKLPQGVSPNNPAYLAVVCNPDGTFDIFAYYLKGGAGSKCLMWSASTEPTWLKFFKHKG